MINGTRMFEIKGPIHKIYEILTKFINGKLNNNGYNNGFDTYINKTFDAFVKNRRQIMFNLWQIRQILVN